MSPSGPSLMDVLEPDAIAEEGVFSDQEIVDELSWVMIFFNIFR